MKQNFLHGTINGISFFNVFSATVDNNLLQIQCLQDEIVELSDSVSELTAMVSDSHEALKSLESLLFSYGPYLSTCRMPHPSSGHPTPGLMDQMGQMSQIGQFNSHYDVEPSIPTQSPPRTMTSSTEGVVRPVLVTSENQGKNLTQNSDSCSHL